MIDYDDDDVSHGKHFTLVFLLSFSDAVSCQFSCPATDLLGTIGLILGPAFPKTKQDINILVALLN